MGKVLPVRQPLDKLRCFFPYGHVGCEFRISAMGESELFERGEHLAGRDGACGKPKSFSERIPHRRCGMAMHLISGSHNFRRNSGIQVCSSKMAPSGQCVRHCPQLMQPSV